jgi:hypothetical protein
LGVLAVRLLRAAAVLLCWLPAFARGDIFVIVNAANPVTALTQKEVLDIYMGRRRAFPSGEYVLPFDQSRNGAARERFYQMLTGMSLSQVNGYWSRLIFTGQMLPPQPLADDATVLDVVRRNPDAIGYVERPPRDAAVTIILVLKAAS